MPDRNPAVDDLVSRSRRWKAETEALRSILLASGLDEELKWGKPCYAFEGGNVAIIQGFKRHCALMFFKGALLKDPEGILVAQGENTQAARRIELTSVEQITELEPILRATLAEAIEVERAGLEVAFEARQKLVLPDELLAAFDQSADLRTAFEALTPGRRRGYVLHFSSAKRSATRAARIAKCAPRILAGKGLHDR